MTQATLVQETICGGDLRRFFLAGKISIISIGPRSPRTLGSDLYLTMSTYLPLHSNGLQDLLDVTMAFDDIDMGSPR